MKIRNTLIVYFLIVLLVPVSVLSFVQLRNSQINLEDQIVNRLNTLADSRKNQVEDFFQGNIDLVHVFANATLSENFDRYNHTPTKTVQSTLIGELERSLLSLREEEIDELSLIDLSGVTIASTNKNSLGINVSKEPFFTEGKGRAGAYFADENGATALSFVAPVSFNGKVIGIARGIGNMGGLIKIIQDRTGLESTGEVLLAQQGADGNPHFLVQRRFESQAVSEANVALPMRVALTGQEKVLNPSSDYRGVQVIAITRYIKSVQAGLVVKIDRSEVNAPLTNVLLTTIVVSLFGILLTILVAWFLSKNFSDPIQELTEITKKVSKNTSQVSFSKKLLESRNEIGVLSLNFKSMIENLSRAYQDIEKSEKRFRETLDNMLEGSMILGFDWTYLYVNNVSAEHGQSKPENLVGKTILEMYPGVEKSTLFAHYKECMEKRMAQHFEESYTFADGSTRWYEFRVSPVSEGIFVLSIEITDRKLAEEKLKELDKLKDDFLMVTTHELKSPLIPIKSQSQLLLAGDYGELNQEQKEAVEMIERNEETINTLASELLDISKIKSNQLKLVLESTNIGDLVAEVVDDMRTTAEQKKLSFSLLPIPDTPEIMVDGSRMRQVIRNLLDNAIKFTPEHGTVSVEVEKTEQDIVVRVKDSGIGIDKDDISKLFVPFFRTESDVTRKYRGTGLGLAVSKGLIETHGGKIWAESEGTGMGSTLAFTLPISVAQNA